MQRVPTSRPCRRLGGATLPLAALAALCTGLVGCGWFGGDEAADADETTPVETITVDPPPIEPDEPEQKLEFSVPVGTRFPLVKKVEQTLRQATPQGTVVSWSELRLQLAVVVEAVHEDGAKTLNVQYHRVRYEHDIAGDRLLYDSATPLAAGSIPPAVQAYHGLVGNGFSFVVDADNSIREVPDFEKFLAVCLREVPPHRKNAVLAELEARYGDEGIANFIDDSLRLLPYDEKRPGRESVVRENQTWTREWQNVRPIPMITEVECRLLHLGEELAEVLVHGRIAKSSTFGPSEQQNETALVVVNGGTVDGHCSIRRDTGLPVRSRVRRTIEMTVRMPDGTAFDQFKTVETTIETFQEQGSPHHVPVIVPAGATTSGAAPSGVPAAEPPVRLEQADFEQR